MNPKQSDELQSIPGVGPSIAKNLHDIGIHSIAALKHNDPDKLYHQLMTIRNSHVDRCVLYVFRCAVYYASHTTHDPHLLKWWHWKDTAKHM